MVRKFIGIFMLSLSCAVLSAQTWDADVVKKINPKHPDSRYWRATSGSAYVLSAATPAGMFLAGLIKKDAGLKHQSYEALATLAVQYVISETLKRSIGRKRPAETYPMDIFPYKDVRGKSFPSGHTSLAFATATSLSLQWKKWYVVAPAYLWAGSVGYSRMYLGVHYPSDVIAGAVVGAGSAYLTHWLNRRLFGKRQANH